jgi:A/G-specific adenine glycosylase
MNTHTPRAKKQDQSPDAPSSAAPCPVPADIARRLLHWYEKHARDLPWRRTRDPYAIWVSEIMLQQTQVKTVVPYWTRWMKRLPDVRSLARAKPPTVLKLWEGLGYYRRAENLQRASRVIVERHDGLFPDNFEEIIALPGIGRYTAGAICSIAFNQPAPILDGNVTRVLARFFGIRAHIKTAPVQRRLWKLSEALVRAAHAHHYASTSLFNQSLMELGALICTPRQPLCPACPLHQTCFAARRGLAEKLPRTAARPASEAMEFMAFVIENKGLYLVRQRPAHVINGSLWEFPNEQALTPNATPQQLARKLLGAPHRLRELCEIQHTITRFRIRLKVFHVILKPTSELPLAGRWCSLSSLQKLPFTAAHKKIIAQLPAPA